MTALRLLSFNIHGGYSRDGGRDLTRIHDLMQSLDVDIGVFQEMETRRSRGGTETDLDQLAGAGRTHRLPGPNLKEGTGWFGNLIVSRYNIAREIYHNLQTAPRYEPRSALDALIDTPLGTFRIVGTHLSLSPLERRTEAKRLMQLIEQVEQERKHPLLLMGDINEWQIPSRLIRRLNRVMTPVPCGATFPAVFPLLRLDRVWHDAPGYRVTAHRLADRESRMLSDHLPVLITVSSAS